MLTHILSIRKFINKTNYFVYKMMQCAQSDTLPGLTGKHSSVLFPAINISSHCLWKIT